MARSAFCVLYLGRKVSKRFADLVQWHATLQMKAIFLLQALDQYSQDNGNNTSAGEHFSSDHEKMRRFGIRRDVIPDSDC